MTDATLTSKLMTYQEAVELVSGAASIDGQRYPLVQFMEDQQREIERLRKENAELIHDNERFCQANVGLVNELASGHETTSDAEDAAKWRILMAMPRMRIIGGAGFLRDDPDHYAFLTVEFWTKHEATTTPEARQMWDRFIEIARKAQNGSLPQEQK